MKIVDVKTAAVQANFEWIHVRVYTDEGLVGLGECYWGAGVETIARHLRNIIVGEDPQNIDYLYQKMIRVMAGAHSQAGATIAAISGVELALWDLKGKILNTPIYNLLGGRYRSKIKIYADCGHGSAPTPEAWRERARAAVNKGFQTIKFDIDNVDPDCYDDPTHFGRGWVQSQQRPLSNQELDKMVELVGAVRETIGPDIDLCLDCHWTYNTRDAIRIAQAMEPFRIYWLEDPTPPDNIEALKRVTDNSPVPICCGENHYTRHGLRQMITSQAVDIIQPDVPKVGGLLEAKKISDLADIYYIPMAAHNVSGPVGTLAACHMLATVRNFAILEFHAQDVDWWDGLIAGSGEPLIQGGYIELPDRPGVGIELNEDVVRAHLKPESAFFN